MRKKYNNDEQQSILDDLISITEHNGQQSLSAREMYKALGLSIPHWQKWYKKNIVDNEHFKENIDWQGFTLKAKGNETQDFIISLDMAKHLVITARPKRRIDLRNYVEKKIADIQANQSSDIRELQELIRITERNGQRAVSARELHRFLEVGRDFSSWIKERIKKYEFTENEDYQVFPNFGKNNSGEFYFDSPDLVNQNKHGGDRRSIEYALSLDMAKELSMVENNEKGKQARRYFIEVEKRYRSGEREKEQAPPNLYDNAFASVYVHEYGALLKLNFVTERLFWVKNILSLILLHGGKRCFKEFGYLFSSQEKAEFIQKQINYMCYNFQVPLKSLNMVCRFGLKHSGLLEKYNKVYKLNYLD